jgi:hypothetical protein
VGGDTSCLGRMGVATQFGSDLFGRRLFGGCRHFWRKLVIPGLQTSVCRWNLLRCFSDFCGSGLWKGSGLRFGNMASSEHVAPVIPRLIC